jgi:hypothetical protein
MATQYMGVGTGSNGPGRRIEPKRAFRWMLEVAPPAEVGIGDIIKTTCFSFGRPQMVHEKITMHRLNTSYHIRGKGEWQDITLTLYDGSASTTNAAKAMYTWQQAIYDPTTDIMLPEEAVKADASVKLLNGAGETIEEWLLVGFAPIDTNWNPTALDMSASDALQVECTFSIDKALLVASV